MSRDRILLGVFGRPHGVRGLVHVASYTEDPSDLAAYGALSDEAGRRYELDWRADGIAAVTLLTPGGRVPVQTREAAAALVNTRLYIDRDRLPAPDGEEFYHADLIGLAALDAAGSVLGIVTAVHDYGGGASLEITRPDAAPVMLPFTRACVPVIDIAAGRLRVAPPDEILLPGRMQEDAA